MPCTCLPDLHHIFLPLLMQGEKERGKAVLEQIADYERAPQLARLPTLLKQPQCPLSKLDLTSKIFKVKHLEEEEKTKRQRW